MCAFLQDEQRQKLKTDLVRSLLQVVVVIIFIIILIAY
jgi:hypothetical protein